VKRSHPDLIRRDLIYLGFEIRGHTDLAQVYDYNSSNHEQLEALALGLWMGGMPLPCTFGTIKLLRQRPVRYPMGTATVYVNSTYLLKHIQLRVVQLSEAVT
jgi:hypothetical protein